MDLSTNYLGFELKNPIVPSASPLTRDLDTAKRMEDAGASALVMHSLFEEQITHESLELDHFMTHGTESFAEALSYYPEPDEFKLQPEEYVEHIAKLKQALSIPVIASLNGVSTGGWVEYGKKMQDAGADALELNIYYIATDPFQFSLDIETRYLEVIREVKKHVTVPVAVKIGPHFTSVANMAMRMADEGADGLALFNRFYQPDIDIEELEVKPNLLLSTSQEMRLVTRWLAILYGQVDVDLAATTGIYTAEDAIKSLMAGANVAMMCSALLRHGVDRITQVLDDMKIWMEEHEYDSVKTMRGSMSQKACPEPAAFERANYMKTLNSYV